MNDPKTITLQKKKTTGKNNGNRSKFAYRKKRKKRIFYLGPYMWSSDSYGGEGLEHVELLTRDPRKLLYKNILGLEYPKPTDLC